MKPREFGVFLRDLRKKKKLTIRQLDLYSGVSHSYISQMERGERGVPKPDILKKLSKPLDMPYDELMAAAGYWDRELGEFLHDVQVDDEGGVAITWTDHKNPMTHLDPEVKALIMTKVTDNSNKSTGVALKALPSRETQEFLDAIDLTSEEFSKKIPLSIDGRLLTTDEAKDFIAFVRAKRSMQS